jgi:hypothetical protein
MLPLHHDPGESQLGVSVSIETPSQDLPLQDSLSDACQRIRAAGFDPAISSSPSSRINQAFPRPAGWSAPLVCRPSLRRQTTRPGGCDTGPRDSPGGSRSAGCQQRWMRRGQGLDDPPARRSATWGTRSSSRHTPFIAVLFRQVIAVRFDGDDRATLAVIVAPCT